IQYHSEKKALSHLKLSAIMRVTSIYNREIALKNVPELACT
ncbi:24956_t:CDS:1, partial [Gigaspora rosea]